MWYRAVGCIVTLTLSILAAPLAAAGQQAGKIPRIGWLSPFTPPTGSNPLLNVNVFREGLRELGWVEGQTIALEYRWAEGRYERFPELAGELVRLQVDVLVALITPAALAAKQATKTIPIVMVAVHDPVESGLVASLARPGGNVTGLSLRPPGSSGNNWSSSRRCSPRSPG